MKKVDVKAKCGWCDRWFSLSGWINEHGQLEWDEDTFEHNCPETQEKGPFVEDWEIVQ